MAVTWDEARQRLETVKAELNAEIGAYPPPITGCDAQFNHLLEQRKAIGADLQRLDEARKANPGRGALQQFIASSPFLQDALAEQR